MRTNRPKISDVARVAGVSTATVSRVLSNPDLVSSDTREAVQEAIRATGYRLNLAARNLRHRRTGSIVALVPNLANPFVSEILSGIAAVLGAAGYNLLVADTCRTSAQALIDYAEPSRAGSGSIGLLNSMTASSAASAASRLRPSMRCRLDRSCR